MGSGADEIKLNPDQALYKKAYVVNYYDGTVSVIDTDTNTAPAPAISVGRYPGGLSFNPDQANHPRAYVTDTNATTGQAEVSVIDTNSDSVVSTIGSADPANVRWDLNGPVVFNPNKDKHQAYVAAILSSTGSQSTVLIEIDTDTDQPTGATVTLTNNSNPSDIAFSPDGSTAYVTGYNDNTLTVVDTGTNAVTGTPISMGALPSMRR